MNKRLFLQTAAASSATLFLDGCANPLVQQVLGSDPLHGDGPLPMTSEDIATSQEARRIFDGYRQMGRLPTASIWTPKEEADIARLKSAIATWKKAVEPYQRVKEIPLSGAATLARAIVPVLRIANDLADGLANAPAKRSEKPALGNKQLASLNGTTLVVPPRSLVQFTQPGYCMDSSFPAPGAGEKLRLLPMERLIPRELLPIYHGLATLAMRDPRVRGSMQLMVWALREAGTNGPHANAIGSTQLAIMATAYPNGDQIFLQYHKNALAQKQLSDMVKNLLKVNINGRDYNLGDFSNPERAQSIVNQTLSDLARMPIPGQIPSDNSDYSMLAPGVAAYAVGSSILTPTITLANTTAAPYGFGFSHHFAESRRRTQRIALSPPEKVLTSDGGRSSGEAKPEEKRGFLKQLLLDSLLFVRDKTIEGFPESRMGKWVRKLATAKANPLVAEAVTLVPVVGNLIQLHNALTGEDLFTGDKIGCAGQVLAGIGTVPGAGIFMKVAGSGLPKAIKLLAKSSVAERLVSSIERTSLERDIASWLSSDTAKMMYEETLPASEVSQRFTEIMTAGCDRG